MKSIHSRFAILAVAGMLAVAPTTLQANNPAARFRGGSYDGYDLRMKIQSDTDWGTFPGLIVARNRGGSFDGYAMALSLGSRLPGRATMILIR
jgi:hypothetical protein